MEFENLQIEFPTEGDKDKLQEKPSEKVWEKTYYNKNKGFIVGFDLNSKEALDRRKQRARRFNMKKEEKISQRATRFGMKEEEQIQVKQDPFSGIMLKDLKWPTVTPEALDEERPEALFLHGVNHMSTKDVFAYFKDYGADTMEWIDDVTCVVVWGDGVGASKAFNGISRTYAQLAVQDKLKENTEDTSNDIQEIVPDDVKQMWRYALPSDTAESLFLRQATKSDKKLPGAASRSQYYLMYGGNRGQGKTGLVSSSRKRKLNQQNEIAKERYTNPEVQFMDVEPDRNSDQGEKMDVDDVIHEPITKRIQWQKPGQKHDEETTNTFQSMYADNVDVGKKGAGVFGRLGKDSDDIKIEVFDKKDEKISGVNRRLDTDCLSSDSEDDEEEARAKTRDNKIDKDVVPLLAETDETSEFEIVVQDDDDDTLYVGEDTKAEETKKNDDLRKQLNSKDLRDSLGVKQVASTIERRTGKGVTDLREKLRQKSKKGFDPTKINLCIEVTEVSEEEVDEEEL